MRTLAEANLSPKDRAAVQAAAALLRDEFGATSVILFGSAARGEAGPDSDLDLLVLLPRNGPVSFEERLKVTEALFPISLEREVLLSTLVVSDHEWREGVYQAMSIHREIARDGVSVLPPVRSAA